MGNYVSIRSMVEFRVVGKNNTVFCVIHLENVSFFGERRLVQSALQCALRARQEPGSVHYGTRSSYG